MSVKEKYKTKLVSIIKNYLPETKIYLFGSRATGTHSQGSDIDIAIDNGEKVPFSAISKILTDIEDTTIPFMVDVVDLNSVSDDFKEQVMKEAVKWGS